MAFIVSDKIKHKKSGEKVLDATDINFNGFSIPSENINAYGKEETYTKQEVDDAMDWLEV